MIRYIYFSSTTTEYLEIKFDEWRKNLKVRKIFISLHTLDEATSDEREEFPEFLLPCIF